MLAHRSRRTAARPRPSSHAGTAPPPSPKPTSGSRGGEAGFALIFALLALILITALATAGFLLATTDYQATRNHRAAVMTFYSADAGQHDYLATQGVPEPTTTYSYGRDAVTVTSRRLLNLPGGESLYSVAADGLDGNPVDGGARRKTSSVAVFFPFPLTAPGAFTAVNGLVKNGSSGTIDGNDHSTPGPCPYGIGQGSQDAVAGVAVPPNGYTQNGGGKKVVPKGDPPVDDSKTAGELLDYMGIDWEGLVTEETVVPDARIPEDSWPDFSSLPDDEWPVIHVTADEFDLTPTLTGRGAIILDGDVELQGDFTWNGVILAGGRLTTNGFQEISGTVITGLNRIFPGKSPDVSEIGNGSKSFVYNSCDVEAALRAMGWLAEKPGTWRELI